MDPASASRFMDEAKAAKSASMQSQVRPRAPEPPAMPEPLDLPTPPPVPTTSTSPPTSTTTTTRFQPYPVAAPPPFFQAPGMHAPFLMPHPAALHLHMTPAPAHLAHALRGDSDELLGAKTRFVCLLTYVW